MLCKAPIFLRGKGLLLLIATEGLAMQRMTAN